MVSREVTSLRFRTEVWEELREATLWYEAKERGLGMEFIRAFEAIITNLERNPRLYPAIYKAARRAVMRRFPYSVIHVVSGDEILVVFVIHGKRDPARWQSRV